MVITCEAPPEVDIFFVLMYSNTRTEAIPLPPLPINFILVPVPCDGSIQSQSSRVPAGGANKMIPRCVSTFRLWTP